RDIPIGLAEQGIVLIFAILIGEPHSSRIAANGQLSRQIVDQIILKDVILLILVEGTHQRAERPFGGRRDADFLTQFLEVIGSFGVLARIDDVAGVVVVIVAAQDTAGRRAV